MNHPQEAHHQSRKQVNYRWAEDLAASCFNGSLKESPQAFDPASP